MLLVSPSNCRGFSSLVLRTSSTSSSVLAGGLSSARSSSNSSSSSIFTSSSTSTASAHLRRFAILSSSSSPRPTTLRREKLGVRTMASATKFYEFKPLDKKGQPYELSALRGKVVLIVNTASKCGFTPQLKGLEALYKEVKATPEGASFEILGFPCNQFGGQDPGSNDEIQEFCQLNYGVSFPVLGKTEVNGDKAEPVYQWLKNEKAGLLGLTRIKWNFEKFLVGKDGQVRERWASTSKPESLKAAIMKELKA